MVRISLVLYAISAVLPLACCTVPMPDGRIVGGQDVDISEYPHQVSIRKGGKHICGGSIININTILTAAHCFNGASSTNQFSINAGSSYHALIGQQLPVKTIWIHGKYNILTQDYDVALMHLEGDLIFGQNVTPINLMGSVPSPGTKVTVTGWGYTSQGGALSDILQKVDVNLVDRKSCQNDYKLNLITERMICASDVKKDSCQGDSGGPLIYKGQLLGIVSWGIGCANPNYPGVYTSVPSVLDWITSQ